MIVVRYDFRVPPDGTTVRADQYATALEQASYLEQAGFAAIVLSEHHATDDGYLPSPLVMAAAVVARTSTIPINVAALLPTLHDPLRLAEDIAVLDHISKGRVSYVLGLGYRPEEYAMFDRPWASRGADIETTIGVLLQAWTGEPFELEGRTVRVTPKPFSEPHPFCFYGGGSPAAARRAARLDLGFLPQVDDPSLRDIYEAECRSHGREPGFMIQPTPGPGVVFCAEDPEQFWDRWGHHLLHDARAYAEWHGDLESHVLDRSETVDELSKGGIYVVWTPEQLIEAHRAGTALTITAHPLCGGLPADPAWASLRLMGELVLPELSRAQ